MSKKANNVVKLVNKEAENPNVDANLVKNLTAELKENENTLMNRAFIVKLDENGMLHLKQFLSYDATWKYTEALGIIEAVDQITTGLVEFKSGKVKGLPLKNLPLEAIAYFMQSYSGKGHKNAVAFMDIVKPIHEALSKAKIYKENVIRLQQELAAATEGIDIEAETEKLIAGK